MDMGFSLMVWVWGRAWRAHCLRLTKPMLQKGKKPQKLQVGAVALGVRQSGGDVSARGPSAAVDEIATSSTDWPFSVGFLDRIATFSTDFAVGPGAWGRNLQVDWLLFWSPGWSGWKLVEKVAILSTVRLRTP